MHRTLGSVVAVTVIVMLAAPLVWAGAQARVKGTILNSGGEPIPDVVMTITTDQVAGYRKDVKIKKNGSFSTLILDATRTYKFHIEAPGYVPIERTFKVPIGSTDNEYEFTLNTVQEVKQEERAQVMEQPGFKEMNEGRELFEQGKLDEAEVQFEAAVAAMPDLVQGWVVLAEISFDKDDHEKARARSEKCLELDDESVRCLAIAANSARELGDEKSHLEYLARYQELNPDDPAALFNQAAELLNKMDDEQARPLLEQCLEADPDFPKCLFEYGMLLLRTGDMEGAKAQLERYLEVAPDGDEAALATETIKYL